MTKNVYETKVNMLANHNLNLHSTVLTKLSEETAIQSQKPRLMASFEMQFKQSEMIYNTNYCNTVVYKERITTLCDFNNSPRFCDQQWQEIDFLF